MKDKLQIRFYFTLCLMFIMFVFCSDKYSENPIRHDINKNFNTQEFKINELEYKELPYVCSSPYPLTRYYPKNSTGAILFLDGYSLTGDDEYLYRAKLQTNRLLDIAIEIEDAIFFPYPFNPTSTLVLVKFNIFNKTLFKSSLHF